MTPNAMPSAPSTICAANPTAMKGNIASKVASETSNIKDLSATVITGQNRPLS